MGSVANSSSSDVEKDHTGASQAGATASPQIPEGRTVTYQLILRHLAKFRDGATALLDLFATHAPAADADRAAPADSGASAAAVAKPAEKEPKSPLEIRIERHMSKVDQALRQIRDLNPERKKKLDLAPEVRDQILTKERTIHDIVGSRAALLVRGHREQPARQVRPDRAGLGPPDHPPGQHHRRGCRAQGAPGVPRRLGVARAFLRSFPASPRLKSAQLPQSRSIRRPLAMTRNSLTSWPITAVVSEKRPVNAPRTRPVMTSVESARF